MTDDKDVANEMAEGVRQLKKVGLLRAAARLEALIEKTEKALDESPGAGSLPVHARPKPPPP
jgi:hypothetical protein